MMILMLIILVAVALFVGLGIGYHLGTCDTEERWNDAVDRKAAEDAEDARC